MERMRWYRGKMGYHEMQNVGLLSFVERLKSVDFLIPPILYIDPSKQNQKFPGHPLPTINSGSLTFPSTNQQASMLLYRQKTGLLEPTELVGTSFLEWLWSYGQTMLGSAFLGLGGEDLLPTERERLR